LLKISGVEVVVADVDSGRAEALAEAEGVAWVKDAEALFCDPGIAAIDVCTSTKSHGELIRRAVESGKDFMCEKPLCETVDEAHRLERLVERSGRIGMVGYIYRFAPVFQEAKRLFTESAVQGRSDALGEVVAAQFRIGGRGSHQLWKHRRDAGGGAINEMLVHMLDLAIWYFGPVDEAKLLVDTLLRPKRLIRGERHEVDAEDYVVVQLRMRNGVHVLCQADLLTPSFTQICEVQGDNGTFTGSIQADMPSFVYCVEPAGGYRAGKTNLDFGPRNLFEGQMAEFVRAVRTQTQPALCAIRDSVLLLEALDMINSERRA